MDKHCELFCAGIWPFLLGPLLLLLPLLYFMWHPIEQRVAENANRALAEESSWATAETYNRGREVLLVGTADDQASVDLALAQAGAAKGVRSVKFVGDIQAPSVELTAPSMSVKLENDRVVLSGELDSQASIDRVLSAAKAQFGADSVTNNLRVGDHVSDLPKIESAFAALQQLDANSRLSLQNGRLSIGGEVSSEERRSAIGDAIMANYKGALDNDIEVIAPPCQLAIAGLLESSKINFATSSAAIESGSNDLLNQIANAATECPEATFEVSGHTDSTGSAETNKQLSEERALAVVNKLAELGLDRQRFSAIGLGAERPLADNTSNAGRAANRRIEFRVTN